MKQSEPSPEQRRAAMDELFRLREQIDDVEESGGVADELRHRAGEIAQRFRFYDDVDLGDD